MSPDITNILRRNKVQKVFLLPYNIQRLSKDCGSWLRISHMCLYGYYLDWQSNEKQHVYKRKLPVLWQKSILSLQQPEKVWNTTFLLRFSEVNKWKKNMYYDTYDQ